MSKKPLTDREFLLDPNRWPQWPHLPMKRIVNHDREQGVIFGDPTKMGNDWCVWFVLGANLWHLKDDTYKQGQYEKIDDLLNAGWKID